MKIMTAHDVWDKAWIETKTKRLMEALSSLECKHGVGILVDNSINGILLTLACIRLGLRTAICPLREPRDVIAKFLNEQGIVTLITSLRAPGLDAINVDDLLQVSTTSLVGSAREFSSLLRTSGTTSSPKIACISEEAHKASARAVCEYFAFEENSCWALSLPLYHVSGLSIIFRALHKEAAIYLAPSLDDVTLGLNNKIITHLSLVPTQLQRLLNAGVELRGATAIVIGGDAMPKALRTRAVALGLRVYETYGLTETASMIWAYDVSTMSGGLLPHARLRIAADQEILVGGDSLFDGYVNDGNQLTKSLCDGFFHTGDLGFIRESELRIEGRKHNRIISGGENIQAEEIERILEQNPYIEQCVVVGIRDDDFGMRPCAVIKWHGVPPCVQDLMDDLKRHVASYKIPKIILTWPSDAPAGLKKPRRWLQQWVHDANTLDKSVIVCA